MNMNNSRNRESVGCLITIRRDEAEALKEFIEANAVSYFEAVTMDFNGLLKITHVYDQIVKAIHFSSVSETGTTVGKKEDML